MHSSLFNLSLSKVQDYFSSLMLNQKHSCMSNSQLNCIITKGCISCRSCGLCIYSTFTVGGFVSAATTELSTCVYEYTLLQCTGTGTVYACVQDDNGLGAVFGMDVAGKGPEVTGRRPAMLHWHPSLALEQDTFMYPHNMFPQPLPSYLGVHCDTVPKAQIVAPPLMTTPEFSSIHQPWPPPPTDAAKHLSTMQRGKMNGPVL